jgi:hypothetical protein
VNWLSAPFTAVTFHKLRGKARSADAFNPMLSEVDKRCMAWRFRYSHATA